MGVILVTKSDSSISPASTDNLPANPLAGDFLALLSAAMYAVYVIWMKVAIGDEERADMRLLLGYVVLLTPHYHTPTFTCTDICCSRPAPSVAEAISNPVRGRRLIRQLCRPL